MAGENRPTGKVGTFGMVLRIGALSACCFVVLCAALELIARATVGTPPALDHNAALLMGRASDPSEIRLTPNPPFVTDAHGIWTARPGLPGINTDGYRSPPFDAPPAGRCTLLLLGDSFTYGYSALPVDRGFADLLRQRGYNVSNCGIPGMATIQYRAQAELYVPRIKPDAVCVMFYTGNDFDVQPPIVPGYPRAYHTNVGMLGALTESGAPLTLEQAAEAYVALFGDGFLGNLRRHSALLHLLNAKRLEAGASARDDGPLGHVRENLAAIRRVAEANGARFFLFLLPTRTEYAGPENDMAGVLANLAEFSPIAVPPVGPEGYAPMPDPHFNTLGHARAAEFMAKTLAAAGLMPGQELGCAGAVEEAGTKAEAG